MYRSLLFKLFDKIVNFPLLTTINRPLESHTSILGGFHSVTKDQYDLLGTQQGFTQNFWLVKNFFTVDCLKRNISKNDYSENFIDTLR